MGKFEEQIAEWCKDAGDGVTYEFFQVKQIYKKNSTTIYIHKSNI